VTASTADKANARKKIQQLRLVATSLMAISETDLVRIFELSHITNEADGWPTGGEGKAARPCGHDEFAECDNCPVETTSVEAAVFARMGKAERDGVGQSCAIVLRTIDELLTGAMAIKRNRDIVFNVRNARTKPAERSDRCECCGDLVTNQGDDRIRSGFCYACYTAWHRWKKDHSTDDAAADRIRFKDWRRGEVAA
jgi:hypothetical protein